MWLLFVLHKVFPPLFVLFLNSLPVIAFTTLLLGVLLIHSEPNTLKRELGDRTKKDSVTESLGFRNEEGLEADSLVLGRRATRRTIAKRVVSSATCANSDPCFEEVSDKKDADSDEWHEFDREQDDGPSDFKSVDDEETSDSSAASAASSVDGSDEGDVGEAYGERDGEKRVVSWSEDDQRILVQIGNSELERNRQLERVIAIRKARLVMVDKNLTDMDDNGGDKPLLHAHHCSIDASRKNPLEHPYASAELGSAPSLLSQTQTPHLPLNPTISKENLSNTVPTSQSKPCLGFRMHMASEQSSCSSDEADEEPESDSSNSHNECESSSSEPNKKPEQLVASDSQFCWFAQSLASVDEHESLSREVSVIEEADVIGHEMYRAHRGSGGPVVRAVPAPAAAKKALLRSSVVSMRM